jgi:hypothetical protein
MKVAIVDGDVSYPSTSGKRLRTLNLLLPLAKRHQLTYIARSQDEAQSQKAASFLAACGMHPILIEEPIHRKQGFGFYARLRQPGFTFAVFGRITCHPWHAPSGADICCQ